MGIVKDNKGNIIKEGDTVLVGSDECKLKAKIEGFTTLSGELMVETQYGDINVSLVEKAMENKKINEILDVNETKHGASYGDRHVNDEGVIFDYSNSGYHVRVSDVKEDDTF